MISSDWYNLDQDNTLGGNNPSILKIPSQKAIREALDTKQDLLTAGENVDISSSVDYDVISGWEYESNTQISVYGLAYGNNKFIKLTNTGATYESTNGLSWSSGTSIGAKTWYNLTFGYNQFVALGFYGDIAETTNGSTWQTATPSETGLGSNYWSGIAYGNGKYVAIGGTGYVSTSVNVRTSWTTPVQNTDLGSNSWQSVTFFNGKFVAIGSQGYISESTDGEDWTTATQNANLGNNDWKVISHTNTQFFAISKYGYVSTSKDGSNWSIATQNSVLQAAEQVWLRVAFSNSIMIATTQNNYTCKTLPTNITLISTVGGGGGSSTDVQINGTSITSNNVANILTNTAYDSSTNKIATMSDVPDVSNCLTNTATGTGSLIIGGTESDRVGATSVGYTSVVSANNTTAIGYNSQATSQHSITIGRNSKTSGASAIQIGYGTNSTANTLSVGFYNNSSTHYNWQLLDGTTGKIPTARIDTDTTATSGSAKPITSGAVYTVLGDIETLINAL